MRSRILAATLSASLMAPPALASTFPKSTPEEVFMSAAPGEIRVHYRNLMRNLVLQAIAD